MIPAFLVSLVESGGLSYIRSAIGVRPERVLAYVQGKMTPRVPTLNTLQNYYKTITYNTMRISGVNIKTANRYKGGSWDKVQTISGIFEKYAEQLAEQKGIEKDVAIRSLARSQLQYEDLADRFELYAQGV